MRNSANSFEKRVEEIGCLVLEQPTTNFAQKVVLNYGKVDAPPF